jgi:hypothetical protein
MSKWFESVVDLNADRELILRRRYGVIETRQGKFVAIHFRPWPKLISIAEARWFGGWKHQRGQRDQCLIYFNQPAAHTNFLTLSYIQSGWATTLATFRLAATILDCVAQLKRSDAIMCEVTNARISDRLFQRWGWEPHLLSSRRRHWIKRFYGDYSKVMPSAKFHADVSLSD